MQSEPSQLQRVLTQYSESSGARFYRWVMGDGGCDIHYGIYSDSASMQEATRASTMRLLWIAQQALAGQSLKQVIDIGAGRGGAAQLIAQTTNAEVTCVDLCQHHHQDNHAEASRLGIDNQIHTVTGDFERLPADFTSKFDLAWSQEAICHAENKTNVFQEVYRVLRPGSVLAFSDILLSESATPESSAAFTNVNAVTRLSTPKQYCQALENAGFEAIEFEDWTEHLADNFSNMLTMIERHRERLINENVPADHIDNFATALRQRLSWQEGEVMRWGAFCCKKKMEHADRRQDSE